MSAETALVLEAALAYAGRGWRVLPLHTPRPDRPEGCSCGREDCGTQAGKHPRIRNWPEAATTQEALIRSWFRRWPDMNVGIATGAGSRLLVFDVDPEKGGRESWRQVERQDPQADWLTVEAITGSLGTHRLFEHPGAGMWLPNRNPFLPGLDVRGDGGYIVAPPSLHRSGRRYAWDLAYHPDDLSPRPLPEWLKERLAQVEPARFAGAKDEGPPAPAEPVLQGCAWLRHCIQDAESLGYGAWYAMLSVAARLEDGPERAHKWSSAYPRYSAAETDALLESTLTRGGPVSCAFVREQAGGEPYCRDCLQWERIKSPIALGRGRLAGLAAEEPPLGLSMSAHRAEELALPKALPAGLQQVRETRSRPGDELQQGNGAWPPPEPPADEGPPAARRERPLPLTDTGNAERLVRRHGENIRYCPAWGRWLVWDGRRWAADEVGSIVERAKETVRAIPWEADGVQMGGDDGDKLRKAIRAWGRTSENAGRLDALTRLAQSAPPVVALPADLDADPWLLNTLNGTVDLQTGALRKHRREDQITRLCPVPYEREAPAPVWNGFLERVLPDPEVRTFVQRAMGYTATGVTSEEVFFLPYGSGRNGKSKFLAAIEHVLGSYAKSTRPETFLSKKSDLIPNDVAALAGARYVPTREAAEGRKLDIALIKQLTGGDTMEARFLGKEFFRFTPILKLWFAVNHKPNIQDMSVSIWERVLLIPFTVFIPPQERDRQLDRKLRAEAPGILAWLVRGCLEWRANGLKPPAAVRAATEEYREEMDPLAGFLADQCFFAPEVRAKSALLYQQYQAWAEANGEPPLSNRQFGRRLSDCGLQPIRFVGGTRGWQGIALREADRPT